jgi:hypothetical protein
MDTETLEKVIGMLDARIIDCNNFIDSDALDHDQFRYVSGTLFGLEELKYHLERYIDKQVAQMETEQGM